MAKNPEAVFKDSIHRYIKIHNQGMYTPYYRGTPDHWYSDKSDLWIEYKYLKKIPATVSTCKLLDPQQKFWIDRRRAEGRRVWVIVGCEQGGVVFLQQEAITREDFYKRIASRQTIAGEIKKQCRKK